MARGKWRTPEQVAAQELELAAALGPESTATRLGFHQRLAQLEREAADGYARLRAGATSRGERWSWTYNQRKAERYAAEHEASAAALAAWLEQQQARGA